MSEVLIKCPQCGVRVHSPTQFEQSLVIPKFKCAKCPAKGRLSWVRGEKVKLTKE